ncbi:MAG TPA: glycosyltransferase family A protein [Verrucomicrobium sp.]|nr:glycosyltransferase family A protein [Verrucomicrobium sp.]
MVASSLLAMQDDLLSVVTRLHTTEGQALHLLGRMLLTLAGSTYAPIQPLIVTQCFTESDVQKVRDLVDEFIWAPGVTPVVTNYFNRSPGDYRTPLLNLGISTAAGRFITILDYDDYVYEHAYETLINQLRQSPAGVAMGGCRVAYALPTAAGYKATSKDNPWAGKTLDDFLTDNIFPTVSYVIDRAKLPGQVPHITDQLTRVEDYELLLKLRAITTFDMTFFETPLCEYFIRRDGTTTSQLGAEIDSSENRHAWESARQMISPLRASLQCLRGRPGDTLLTLTAPASGPASASPA